MRTLIIIAIGLFIAFCLVKFLPKQFRIFAGMAFSFIWLGLVFLNLKTGLSHGYSLSEEAPIQILIFLVPTAVYWGYCWFKK